MAETATAEETNVAQLPVRAPLMAGAPVRAIVPQSMEDAFRIATAVVKAGMAPRGMETAEKCLIAVMQGAECGMTPMQSIQRIAVINGRPTIWGDAAIGLVRASGLCEFVKERIDGDDDKMVAVCEAKRKGEAEPITGRFSVDDAKRAGLWNKDGPWKAYPKRMLQMRARGFVLRDGFADVLGGMYLREELEGDVIDVTPEHIPAPPPAPPSAPKALTPPPAKKKQPGVKRAKAKEPAEPEGPEETKSASAELPGDFGPYLERMKDEFDAAKTDDDRKAIVDTVADALLGAVERNDLTDEECAIVETAWAEMSGHAAGSG